MSLNVLHFSEQTTLSFPDHLISTVKEAFDRKKSKYVNEDEMKQLLEQNLTPEEAEQAITIAEANDVIQRCFPYTYEINGEPSYELLTEEEDLEEDTQIKKKKERTNKKEKKGAS